MKKEIGGAGQNGKIEGRFIKFNRNPSI